MKGRLGEEVFIFKFNAIKPERPAEWKSKAVAVIHECFVRTRIIYIPIWEKRDISCAMADEAKVYFYRKNPYIDLDWFIHYSDTIGNESLARLLRIHRMEWERLLEENSFRI